MPELSSKHVYSGMASIKNVLQILLINSENMFLMVKLYNEQQSTLKNVGTCKSNNKYDQY